MAKHGGSQARQSDFEQEKEVLLKYLVTLIVPTLSIKSHRENTRALEWEKCSCESWQATFFLGAISHQRKTAADLAAECKKAPNVS